MQLELDIVYQSSRAGMQSDGTLLRSTFRRFIKTKWSIKLSGQENFSQIVNEMCVIISF